VWHGNVGRSWRSPPVCERAGNTKAYERPRSRAVWRSGWWVQVKVFDAKHDRPTAQGTALSGCCCHAALGERGALRDQDDPSPAGGAGWFGRSGTILVPCAPLSPFVPRWQDAACFLADATAFASALRDQDDDPSPAGGAGWFGRSGTILVPCAPLSPSRFALARRGCFFAHGAASSTRQFMRACAPNPVWPESFAPALSACNRSSVSVACRAMPSRSRNNAAVNLRTKNQAGRTRCR